MWRPAVVCDFQAALALQPAQKEAAQNALVKRDAALDLVARRRRRLISELQAAAATKHCDLGNITLACTVRLDAGVGRTRHACCHLLVLTDHVGAGSASTPHAGLPAGAVMPRNDARVV